MDLFANPMQTTNEQNPEPSKAPEEQASGQAAPAAVQPEADRKADDRSKPSAKGHRRHGKGQGRREQAKPLPQGALQDAIRGAAGDWKAFRNEQTALEQYQRKAMRTLAVPDACERIVNIILDVCR